MNDSLLRARSLLQSVIEGLGSWLEKYKQKDYATKFLIDLSTQRIKDLKEVEEILQALNLSQTFSLLESVMRTMTDNDNNLTTVLIRVNLKPPSGNQFAFIEIDEFQHE